jgi:hypothetical protein
MDRRYRCLKYASGLIKANPKIIVGIQFSVLVIEDLGVNLHDWNYKKILIGSDDLKCFRLITELNRCLHFSY